MKLREEEFYEQYHQHGGTTIIPTEIFNELYDDATEEIDRLTAESTKWESKFYDEAKKVDNIKEFIEKELGNINTNENIIAKGICLKIKEIIGRAMNNENNRFKR